jgi:hypothetical protein
VTFSNENEEFCQISIQWKRDRDSEEHEDELILRWSLDELRPEIGNVDDEIQILRERDDDQAKRTELAAVVVAIAVMSQIEPETLFTRRSSTGTRHDYYLNDSRDEMIEVAGRWQGGLPGLFDEKKLQSDVNQTLRKRWISVSIIRENPRNRTEGLHNADQK